MRTTLYSLRIGIGQLRIRRDWTDYRINTELIPFDEGNPPEVDPNTVFAMLPRFTNDGPAAVGYTVAGSVTDPDGAQVLPHWYLDPSYVRTLDPGATGGIGFQFTASKPGDYTMEYQVFGDGQLSNSWQTVVCRVTGEPPEEPPETEGLSVWPFVAAGALALAGVGTWFWWKK